MAGGCIKNPQKPVQIHPSLRHSLNFSSLAILTAALPASTAWYFTFGKIVEILP